MVRTLTLNMEYSSGGKREIDCKPFEHSHDSFIEIKKNFREALGLWLPGDGPRAGGPLTPASLAAGSGSRQRSTGDVTRSELYEDSDVILIVSVF